MDDKELSALKALAEAVPQEQWERDGRTVYSLQHAGWRKRVEQLENRFYFSVQPGRGMSDGDAEAIAELIAAANPATILSLISRLEQAEASSAERANNAIDQTILSMQNDNAQGGNTCWICGENEPRTGACGSSDPRALCNRTAPARDVRGLTEEFTESQKRNIACMDSWANADALPLYSHLYDLTQQYDTVLRNLAMSLSAGGWNSDGLIDPTVADEKIRWGIDALVAPMREVLATSPAPSVEQETTVAYMHEDGRVVPAKTMDTARRDGGATASSLRGYTIELVPRATIAAPSASQGEVKVPEGFAIVPVEPTPAMLIAGVKGFQKAGYNDCDKLHDWTACYRAMIAAAPAPSVMEGEKE